MSILTLLLSAVLVTGPNAGPDKCPDACTLTAQPVSGSINIDGHLDEADWQTAPIATDFIQFEPNEGAEPSQQTEVRILYGGTDLFIAATLYDDEPDKIFRMLGRRDEVNQADWFFAAIDSYFDRKTAYTFGVNAAGVQVDGILTRDLDESWDAVWDSAVRITNEGWIVEMRIPYSMLRFSESEVQRWGINFRRVIPRLSETDEWVLIPRTERAGGTVSRYGVLEGLNNIQPRRNIQVTPYTVSQVLTEEDENNPGERFSTSDVDLGGDLKVGLSSNITLDATINPDFGQVESDPAELNLTAFETFFPEKRPFFTEGVQIFDFELDRGGSLLYTRRIGARAPIIGATKVSGRTDKGLSLGLFGAVTGDDFDPGRFYSVARLQQQLGTISSVGGMLTFYERTVSDPRRSVTGGTDWDLRMKNNTYKFDGQVSFTRRMEPGAGVDPESGFMLTTGFDRVRGIWRFNTGVTIISDDYNPNDIGRLRQNNYTNFFGGFQHQVNGGKPFGPFRRGTARLFFGQGFSYREGLSNGFGFFFRSDWETKGFNEIELGARSDYLLGGYDVNETRGLGPREQPRELSVELSITSDTRRTWQLEPDVELEFFGNGGHAYEFGLETEFIVNSRVSFSTEIEFGKENDVTEWASNEAFAPLVDGWVIGESSRDEPDEVEAYRAFDDGGTLDALFATADPYDDEGRYYLPVFGERDTRSVDLTLRSDITLSPTLSIQFYGQLFAARGQYDAFSLLLDRDTLAPFDAYPKQHDFAFTSFQTNAVLRWEYRPGSTLFIVWSQSRQGDVDVDAFNLADRHRYNLRATDQLIDTFDLFPKNAFLVKLSYKFLR